MPMPAVGARVRVPVGTRMLTGCVVEHRLRARRRRAEGRRRGARPEPLLPAAVVELCRWVADYYLAGVGDAIGVAMPPGAQAQRRRVQDDARGDADDAAVGHGELEAMTAAAHREAAAALDVLSGSSTGLPPSELRDRGVTAECVGRLAGARARAAAGTRPRARSVRARRDALT